MMRYFAPLAFVTVIASAMGMEGPWKEYINPRFGFRISYPISLVASPDPQNGGGREFHTKDNAFSLATFGSFFTGGANSFEASWAEELKQDDITYKRKTADWYVVSGVRKNGVEYYHKLCRQGNNAAGFEITYPHARNAEFDPWVEHIEKNFTPFLKGDFDRVK